jgi:hypothetical protein
MNNSAIFKYAVLIFILVSLMVIWIITEQQSAYPEPHHAIKAADKELLLIPAYKMNDESLYFFIKDKNNLGAVEAQKGIFGWKTGMFTWSPMDSNRVYENLAGFHFHGDSLIYGLIRNGDERIITVDGQEAEILNLGMLPLSDQKENKLEGLYLWYYEGKENLENAKVELLHRDREELIQSENY